jgi:hypothetical protein
MNADQKSEFASARTKMLFTGVTFVVVALMIWAVEGLIVGSERSDELAYNIQSVLLLGFACVAAAGVSLIADFRRRSSNQR